MTLYKQHVYLWCTDYGTGLILVKEFTAWSVTGCNMLGFDKTIYGIFKEDLLEDMGHANQFETNHPEYFV